MRRFKGLCLPGGRRAPGRILTAIQRLAYHRLSKHSHFSVSSFSFFQLFTPARSSRGEKIASGRETVLRLEKQVHFPSGQTSVRRAHPSKRLRRLKHAEKNL